MNKILVVIICCFSIILLCTKHLDVNCNCNWKCIKESCECHHCDNENVELLGYTYTSVCWRCHSSINSNVNSRCSKCGWYICNRCGACDWNCPRCPAWNGDSTTQTKKSKKNDNSWVWIIVIGGVIVGGVCFYKKNKE